MVTDPKMFADVFINAGADQITFHVETIYDKEEIKALAKHIHEQGKKAGLTLKPQTPIEVLKPFLHDFDLFLIMSVNPGFGGQKFMPEALERIRTLRTWLNDEGLDTHIELMVVSTKKQVLYVLKQEQMCLWQVLMSLRIISTKYARNYGSFSSYYPKTL